MRITGMSKQGEHLITLDAGEFHILKYLFENRESLVKLIAGQKADDMIEGKPSNLAYHDKERTFFGQERRKEKRRELDFGGRRNTIEDRREISSKFCKGRRAGKERRKS